MGLIPQQTKAENKLKWGLTKNRMLGLVLTILISTALAKAVHKYLAIPFMIFCVAVFLYTQQKSPTNPKKQFIFGLRDYLKYLVSPKKYYGLNGEEYKLAQEQEEKNNEKKKGKAKNTAKE